MGAAGGRAGQASAEWGERRPQTGPRLQGGTDHQNQHRGEPARVAIAFLPAESV